MTHTPNNFNPTTTPLATGTTLIEASAGTGKTYTLALLVLRFVIEQHIDIKQILVVTFTIAATKELKDRIRKRFVETRLYLLDKNTDLDDQVKQWLNQLPLTDPEILQRINMALLDMDQASIFTIHSFCQRTLTEHALESGQLFDAELMSDLTLIKQQCSDDFWRKNVYLSSAWQASLLTADYPTPDKLLASIDRIKPSAKIIPNHPNLNQALTDLHQAFTKQIQAASAQITLLYNETRFKPAFRTTLQQEYPLLLSWLHKTTAQKPDLSLFNHAAFIKNLASNIFTKSKANPKSSTIQKQEYIDSLAIDFSAFEQLNTAIKNISLIFRHHLFDHLHQEVSKQLQQQNALSFDDIIINLAKALNNDKEDLLCHAIQQHYQVALIDEFQDTDNEQWHIFSTLFNTDNHYLYLIGDPKQAIYKFRGADIHTYFTAKQAAKHHFNLGFNWRSNPDLVKAVNHLFTKNNPFRSETLDFHPVRAGLTEKEGQLTQADNKIPPLVLSQLDNPAEKSLWTTGKARDEINISIINEVLDLLNLDFKIQNQPIQANDIAILVRSNRQAEEFQQAFNSAGITAIINSKKSVFSSNEARHLYTVLQAAADPTNNRLLKQALTVDWFHMDGQQLFTALNNEKIMDGWLSRFLDYQLLWQTHGLMTMMQQLFDNEKVHTHLCGFPYAERRMTNLQHCIELVQQAAIDQHIGLYKTLDWLRQQLTKPKNNQNDQELRLESDENAVKIMTIHNAKGLEFPIVFCPFLWDRDGNLKKEKSTVVCYADHIMIADIGSDQFESHKKMALAEELQENLRIFYVAVTRAKYRCYIHWVDARTKTIPNSSAMADLFDFYNDDFDQQQQKLTQLQTENNTLFEYRLLKQHQQINSSWQQPKSSQSLQYQQLKRSLYSHWQMSSYSALSYLSTQYSPETPTDKAREEVTITENTITTQQELPRGAHTGNVLHTLLENISFTKLANQDDITEQRDKACLYYSLKTEHPEQINHLLAQTVRTPLSIHPEHQFCLNDLTSKQCLKEMPFYLSMKTINVAAINTLLKHDPAFQSLSDKTMSGYLTGFIDLVCEYQGKYYIIDYKSNGLDNYTNKSLTHSMREHNYGLQYWIYTLVLHRYLEKRLPDYDYEQHMGGVMYLFLRGMDENQLNSGVYHSQPQLEKITQLANFFYVKA